MTFNCLSMELCDELVMPRIGANHSGAARENTDGRRMNALLDTPEFRCQTTVVSHSGAVCTRRIARRIFLRRMMMVALSCAPAAGFAREIDAGRISAALEQLEAQEGGRLGVGVLDTASGRLAGHRLDERFALCSTFKFVLSAMILQRVDAGTELLARAIPVVASELLPGSPVSQVALGRTLTVRELCRAIVTTSDNTAANLLLHACGGPAAVTAFLRTLGDAVTRLDRHEPDLNNHQVGAGDLRDTTSPAAMAATMQRLLLGEVISGASRALLTGWLREAATGLTRLRGGFPPGWDAGDKTGTGADGPTNDIAIAWPPGRAPLIVTAYYDRTGHAMAANAAVLAQVGRLVGQLA